MSLLTIAAVVSAIFPPQGKETRQRLLIVAQEPTPAMERILQSPTIDSTETKRSRVLRVLTDRLELLVDEDLWNPASIRLASVAVRTLAASKNASVRVGDLPTACQSAILGQMNSLVRVRTGSAFDVNSQVALAWECRISVSDDQTTKTLTASLSPPSRTDRQSLPRPTPGTIIHSASEPMPSVKAKRNLVVRFPNVVSDRIYWEGVSESYKVLVERRHALENALREESDTTTRSLFPESTVLSSTRKGDDPTALPKPLREAYEHEIRLMGLDRGAAFRQSARISDIRTSLTLVFRYGRNEFAFSPMALFESP